MGELQDPDREPEKLAARNSVTEMLSSESIEAARQSRAPGAIWTVEGVTSLKDRSSASMKPIRMAYGQSLLCTTGQTRSRDAMTNAPLHNGLTLQGDAIIREMNRLGMMMIDRLAYV